MLKPIEMHKILELCDEESLLKWIAENIDCDAVVLEYGMESIVHYTNEEDWLIAILRNSGKEFMIDWVMRNIGQEALKEYIDEVKYERGY